MIRATAPLCIFELCGQQLICSVPVSSIFGRGYPGHELQETKYETSEKYQERDFCRGILAVTDVPLAGSDSIQTLPPRSSARSYIPTRPI